MTSTGTYSGMNEGRSSSKVLKPPGGGSSDIFGANAEVNSPRRVNQQHNQSSLSSSFFGNGEISAPRSQAQTPSSTQSNGAGSETPRNKPGNDSYKRLFGPPDAPPPSTPNKNHQRSNVLGSAEQQQRQQHQYNTPSVSRSSSSVTSPSSTMANGHVTNGNGYHHNDVVGGSSGMARNPVTGDGVDVTPVASRRIVRRSRDGNPVTGAGYDSRDSAAGAGLGSGQQNGNANGSAGSSAASDKSSTDSSPAANPNVVRMKNRVPPGGYSSGLW